VAGPSLELTDAPDEASLAAILDGLKAFNAGTIGPSDLHKLAVLIKVGNATVGGLSGHTIRGWLYIDMIFVPEGLRGQGLATQLLATAEAEAIARGCRAVWMDTVNPDALKLYRSLGYEICGELPDFARGLSCFFLHKRLITA
jgi:ribosomal protein S18 acetylase RimI-like enzyme